LHWRRNFPDAIERRNPAAAILIIGAIAALRRNSASGFGAPHPIPRQWGRAVSADRFQKMNSSSV
jgi:hypothetical protein